MRDFKINGQRLWQSLMDMAQIGATAGGGVCRLALTDSDRAGRDLFVRWCGEANCTVTYDSIGNIFARREGRRSERPPVVAGSHLDSQPNGGRFDGTYGVLAALEVARTLNDAGHETEAPIEIAVWTNEEGSRFSPAMLGSAVFAGRMDLNEAYAIADADGKTVGEELERIGYKGEGYGDRSVAAYFEAHIEQGPFLEAGGKTIGVVTGGQGQIWYDATFIGEASHAGTTPMARRRDALVGAASLVQAVQAIGRSFQPKGYATVGTLQVKPNSRNVIPGEVSLTAEVRHADDSERKRMDVALRHAAQEVADRQGLELKLERTWERAATTFDAGCIAVVREGAVRGGFRNMDIVSAAGHDAFLLAEIAPTGMIFVPCKEGISHNEAESATSEDLAAGCQVLLHAVVKTADREGSQ